MNFSLVLMHVILYILAFGLFGVTILSTIAKNNLRKSFGLAGLVIGFVMLPFIWVQQFAVIWSVILTLVAAPVLVDAGRMYAARFNDRDKATLSLIDAASLAVIFAVCLIFALFISGLWMQIAVTVLALVAAFYGMSRFVFATRHFRFSNQKVRDNLPSITLAIPARNETNALSDCLMAASASDYTKMEIIVLDDCSQDRTSQIIRSFAQSGVQFVQGDEPSDGWLGKNNAMRKLTEHANGEFIVFMNVDTKPSEQTLSLLISDMIAKNLEMISILPRRNYAWHASGIFEVLRYFWQILLPVTSFRTPVSSSLWIIRRETLEKLGGFQSQKYKVLPENHFARALMADRKYRFYFDSDGLGIADAKKWKSQTETAIRILYPTLHRKPIENLAAIIVHALLLAPYIFVILGLVNQSFGALFFANLACVIALGGINMLYASLVRSSWILAFVTFPFQLIQETVLLIISMLAYEFSVVNWKGRNVCYPVMEPRPKT